MNHQKKRVAFGSDLEVLCLYPNVRAGWINGILTIIGGLVKFAKKKTSNYWKKYIKKDIVQ